MASPIIGINTSAETSARGLRYSLLSNYVECVGRAGGTPLLLPFVEAAGEARAILDRVDGVLFTGGSDLDPSRWGEKPHPKAELMPAVKERSDEVYCRAALARDLPTLGICLGCQLINVTAGGTLHQHLPDLGRVSGAHLASSGRTHSIRILDPRLEKILGYREGRVNSYHHQGVNRVGRGLKVAAQAEDGVVEALVGERSSFVLGVQWHPERMREDESQQALFRELVRRAGRHSPRSSSRSRSSRPNSFIQ